MSQRTKPRSFGRVALFVAGLAALPAPALGQPGQTADEREAERLYKEAAASMLKKDYAAACPKFEAVTRLAPSGGGVRLNLAECYEEWGKLASAWKHNRIAESIAKKDNRKDRIRAAAAQAARIKPKLATLVIEVSASVRADPGALLTLDGERVDADRWGTPEPVDRGKHSIRVSSPGYETITIAVDIAEDGKKNKASVPPLKATPAPDARAASPGPAGASDAGLAASDGTSTPRSKLPAYLLGIGGVVGLATGGALVGLAFSKAGGLGEQAPKLASGGPACAVAPAAGEDAKCGALRATADSAIALNKAGVGLLIGGGALVTGAVVLWLLPQGGAPAEATSMIVPTAGKNGGGLVWIGSF